jgi:shikimate 5-dehydrogenase
MMFIYVLSPRPFAASGGTHAGPLGSVMAFGIRKGHLMELQSKVVLVTGAGSGIGKAAAVRLARAGASVGVLSRTEDEIQATVRENRVGRRAGHPAYR